MELDQSTRACINCQNLFPADRIDLHEAYCTRNIKKCKQCGMFVDSNELNTHQNEFHQKKTCTHCKLDFLTNDLLLHVPQCPRRPKACGYCETNFALSQLAIHEISCGTRTRVCTNCHQNVMLKDLMVHQTRCREYQSPTVPRQPNSSNNLPNLALQNRINNRAGSRGRQRQSGENNVRPNNRRGQHSLSNNKNGSRIIDNRKGKYDREIPLQSPQPYVSILPVSVQLTINKNKKKQQRERETLKVN